MWHHKITQRKFIPQFNEHFFLFFTEDALAYRIQFVFFFQETCYLTSKNLSSTVRQGILARINSGSELILSML